MSRCACATDPVLSALVGVQWELQGAVARRDQNDALGLFLSPRPVDGHAGRIAI
jgi:hypothetical protein